MSLTFTVSVLVKRHANGTVTARVLGSDDLVAWGPALEDVREDLELALIDRIERSHPSLLHRYQAPRGRERVGLAVQRVIELMDVAAVDADRALREAVIDVLVEPEGEWQNAWIPELDARLWIAEGEALDARVQDHVDKVLKKADTARRLALRPENGMELVELELVVEPAPLVAFTGDHANTMMLPEPRPEEEKEAEEQEKKKVPTPTLDSIGIEVTADKDALVRAHGRETEVADLLRMLEQPGAVVAVVGPDGSGKSALIDQVARELEKRRAWFCDASRLVNAGLFTGWRQQTLDLLGELVEVEGIWMCGEPVDLLDAGKHVGSEMNVAQLIKPFLSNGQVRVLAECSEATWGRLEARDAGFARLFTPYRMVEPPAERVRGILDAVAGDLPVSVAPDGIDAALGLARRYGPAEALLGSACHFLRRLTAEARARGEAGPLGRLAVIRRFCAETGLPELLVRDEVPLEPAAVREAFRARLVGQDPALDHMVDLIAVIKGGMSDLGRPLGSFLFVGPTGVGKTETAKALAEWLFGRADRLLRFDMSEYSGPDCLQRLLDREAGLVAKVRQTPFCVVLLDEIEKAHGAVFDLLLQVLGEARLSDADGRTADFRNAVVLMTSNLGVGSFRRPTGFGSDLAASLQDHVLKEVERFFRPELFNRIDRVVPFASLGADAIAGIAEREVAAVARREGLKGRGVELDLDARVVPWLAARGVDVQYGARPLKRAVGADLVAPLARHLSGTGMPPRIQVRVEGDRLAFANAEAGTKAPKHLQLKTLLERASELRYRVSCWLQTSACRQARHEVRLVERLMSAKRFWADERAARARAEALQPVSEALAALDDARAQIFAAEELAHEAWQHRDASVVHAIEGQLAEVEAQLVEAGYRLAGARHPKPEVGWLRLAGDRELLRDLVGDYVMLADERGWKVEIRPTSGAKLEWPASASTSLDAFVHKLRKAVGGDPWQLRFEGPHAATLLAGEGGGVVRKDPNDPKRVVVEASDVHPSKAMDMHVATARVFDPRNDQLKSNRHGVTTTLHARASRSILALMQLELYVRMHGPERGKRLWKGAT
ncbi:MAG: ATP-dependent Clp protease ATP-binding subunit [Alphaproteobacteria bacterium]|nr:ATP-dependent Clp protease ATP-binding subunit [Alphaproteobacteria bacterium]